MHMLECYHHLQYVLRLAFVSYASKNSINRIKRFILIECLNGLISIYLYCKPAR